MGTIGDIVSKLSVSDLAETIKKRYELVTKSTHINMYKEIKNMNYTLHTKDELNTALSNLTTILEDLPFSLQSEAKEVMYGIQNTLKFYEYKKP